VPLVLWLAPAGWPRRLAWVGVALLLAPAVRGAFPDDWMFTVYGPQPMGALLVAAGWVYGVVRAEVEEGVRRRQ